MCNKWYHGYIQKRLQKDKDCGDELVKSPVSKEAVAQIARQRPTLKYMKEEDGDNEKDEEGKSHP